MRLKGVFAAGIIAALSLGANAWGQGNTAGPSRASAYINPDTGTATENPNVDKDSECRNADRRDSQPLSLPAMTDKNVHIDACLFKNKMRFDGPVTWRSRGVGVISACPDPDMVNAVENGSKVAYLDSHGRGQQCHQSGYQEKGAAGDKEYHVRVNNSEEAGKQVVVFCYDPEQVKAAGDQPKDHGCGDESIRSRVVIRWTD